MRADEILEFRARLERFPEDYPEFSRRRVVYGAVAYWRKEADARAHREAAEAAKTAGILVMRCAGKAGLKFANPDREKLRAARG